MSAIRVENKVTQHGSCNCNFLLKHNEGGEYNVGKHAEGGRGLRNA